MISSHHVTTPNGLSVPLAYRPDVGLDFNINIGVLTEDEYRLAGRRFSGVMLDVGGYIGTVGVALAVENPDLRVYIVEPLPENCAVIAESIRLNGLSERVTVIEAAAGTDEPTEIHYGFRHIDGEPDGYVNDNRYVGNIWTRGDADVCTVGGVSLTTFVQDREIERIALLKVDCEGCEWALLRDPAVDRVDEIVGEWHGDPGLKGLRKLLRKTHTVEQIGGNDTNGIFRATHA